MKVFAGAVAAAALLLASPAAAQTNACAFAPAPPLADGAAATHEQMTEKNTEIAAWVAQREQQEDACEAQINALQAQLAPMVSAYNAAGPERVQIVNSWNAEVQEFSARPQQPRRQRGGVLTSPDH